MGGMSCRESIIIGIKNFCEKEDFFIEEKYIFLLAEEIESVQAEEGI